MDKFVFSQTTRTHAGEGIMENALREELPHFDKRVLLGYGKGSAKASGLLERVRGILEDCGKEVVEFGGIMPNPTYAKVQEGAALARKEEIGFILALGGGSVSDCCKMVAAQALTDKDLWDMETADGLFPDRALPVGVVVTASGTGSEQNNDAVITNEELYVKRDLYGLKPEFAVLDPTLTLSVPMPQVMAGAFDSLSHVMESYFGKPFNSFITDELSEAVMRNIIRNMRRVLSAPSDTDARAQLMWDSALAENGLLKLGKKGDFQCHMIEHQLGAYTDCSHGQGLAVLHPVVYRHILKDNPMKFRRFAVEVWGIEASGRTDEDLAARGIDALEAFIAEVGLPSSFGDMGLKDILSLEMMRRIAQSTIISQGCARKLSPIEILQILRECL